ncbi:transaldolase family protein [Candidatus Nitrospira neomarina]|uniref:Transaldolase family protein n=1 Tax=Candidatus Nitrospira neomarina TaxID=3020899 RepID=A0AA96JXJ0_9BACT|nr:transaldolase family protein [Candidatus Nitrospira neomarina]WNM63285.1 transaldolase family protein [Candidatus Nitrospira neomarina]
MSTKTFTDVLGALGQPKEKFSTPRLSSSSRLKALRKAGTSHIYADTADFHELQDLVAMGENAIMEEVDGNTVNQPLVKKVIAAYLDEGDSVGWMEKLRSFRKGLPRQDLFPMLYAIVCGRIGNNFSGMFGSGRAWEVSLQLHMKLMEDPTTAKQIGRDLRKMVPSALVKIPFTPHLPSCLFVARDLEQEGIPVNFTSTFSARQGVMGALLANITRTNIFMGRLDQGLETDYLGAHVSLETQRHLLNLRKNVGIKTQLIVASMRQGKSFLETAGCDVYTAPCKVIQEFLDLPEVPQEIPSQVNTSYEDRLGIPPAISAKLTNECIARLYRVEPELREFLLEYRATKEYAQLQDADALVKRFDQAGFKDLFYAPAPGEWEEIRRSKIPDPAAPLTRQLPLDTLYTLMADADFEKHQAEMDQAIEEYMSR